MPELPEVETTRRGIEPHVMGHKVTNVIVRDRRLRWAIPPGFEQQLAGGTVDGTRRRAKYLFCLLYTSPSPRDLSTSRMPSSA